jgi:tetrahydromethanopterin S-methyltransferase subunit G
MDEDRNKKLEEIEKTLKEIKGILTLTRWQMFAQGVWRAIGYLIGLILAIIIISWVLNMMGYVPFLNGTSETLKGAFDSARSR